MSAAMPDRLMSVEGKGADAELELRGRSREVRERLQAGSGRLVVRPQRVVPEMLAAGGEVTSESCVETGGDAQPSADRRGGVQWLAHAILVVNAEAG